ncbi:hypothetical protein HWV00_20885 (plasmid) [Moritella sp. 24]|uniref:hypothetical protein n=1 Tax=Moritella sp. 24 TaxID=2746230 RepID=UPI001BA7E710|nr:hypothetical protein [Moritella sp. 24]QUM78730.1 hypothetical protein HWV00_20885 [Moritella sp. 24]
MDLNHDLVCKKTIEITNNLLRAIKLRDFDSIEHFWKELLDFRDTVSAIESSASDRTSYIEVLDKYIADIRPVYESWHNNRP